jgi:hypothetical protein
MSSTQRPAPGRPLSPLTGDSTIGAVISEFIRAAGPGGRELRSALSHIDAELGIMPVRSVRPRHLTALLDGLRGAGLSPEREAAIEDALHALFAFAVARRLVAVDPTPGGASQPLPRSTPTPTFTMLALGARVAFWTTWVITLGFLALLLVLLVELG